jgi:hypothetical protein
MAVYRFLYSFAQNIRLAGCCKNYTMHLFHSSEIFVTIMQCFFVYLLGMSRKINVINCVCRRVENTWYFLCSYYSSIAALLYSQIFIYNSNTKTRGRFQLLVLSRNIGKLFFIPVTKENSCKCLSLHFIERLDKELFFTRQSGKSTSPD